MKTNPETAQINLTGADGFVLALDTMMHRKGQVGLIGQSWIELATTPNLPRLIAATERLFSEHPLLSATIQRHWLTFRPYWQVRWTPLPQPALLTWQEDAQGELTCETGNLHSINVAALGHTLLNQRLGTASAPHNLRIDLILRHDSNALLLLTWAHTLFDGKGAEMLLEELIAMDRGEVPSRNLPPPRKISLRALRDKVSAVGGRFAELGRFPIRSLSGPNPTQGDLQFKLTHLNKTQSDQIKARATALTGPLFHLPFFLACVARAHRAVFQQRGTEPEHYIISLPVQVRKKSQADSPFQNRVSILFFHLSRKDLTTLETATRNAQQQFEQMTRAQLDRSFDAMLSVLKRVPSRLYIHFVRSHFKGEFNSFYHSHTGEFAPSAHSLCGAEISNAYHIPSVSAPPGSGVFFSEKNGLLTLSYCWRDNSSNQQETTLLLNSLMADLLPTTATAPRGSATDHP